jgi:hypothetical protein
MCRWDIKAHANSNMQGTPGRLVHRYRRVGNQLNRVQSDFAIEYYV